MYNIMKEILQNSEFSIIERLNLPSREAKYRKIPDFLLQSKIGDLLKRQFAKSQLLSHQSIALEEINLGKNLVVSTSTASGKSLIFRIAAFHRILQNTQEKVLVFYPLKAPAL